MKCGRLSVFIVHCAYHYVPTLLYQHSATSQVVSLYSMSIMYIIYTIYYVCIPYYYYICSMYTHMDRQTAAIAATQRRSVKQRKNEKKKNLIRKTMLSCISYYFVVSLCCICHYGEMGRGAERDQREEEGGGNGIDGWGWGREGKGGMLPLRDMFRAQGKMIHTYNNKIIGP